MCCFRIGFFTAVYSGGKKRSAGSHRECDAAFSPKQDQSIHIPSSCCQLNWGSDKKEWEWLVVVFLVHKARHNRRVRSHLAIDFLCNITGWENKFVFGVNAALAPIVSSSAWSFSPPATPASTLAIQTSICPAAPGAEPPAQLDVWVYVHCHYVPFCWSSPPRCSAVDVHFTWHKPVWFFCKSRLGGGRDCCCSRDLLQSHGTTACAITHSYLLHCGLFKLWQFPSALCKWVSHQPTLIVHR